MFSAVKKVEVHVVNVCDIRFEGEKDATQLSISSCDRDKLHHDVRIDSDTRKC